MNILFPILKIFESVFRYNNDLDIISQNNLELANELKSKNMPAMSAKQIQQYINNKNKNNAKKRNKRP